MSVDTRIVIGTWWLARQPASDCATIYVNHRTFTLTRGPMFVRLPPEMFKMAAVMLSARLLTYDEFYAAMYGDRQDGGPEFVRILRKVMVCRVNQRLRHIGIRLATRWGIGMEAIVT